MDRIKRITANTRVRVHTGRDMEGVQVEKPKQPVITYNLAAGAVNITEGGSDVELVLTASEAKLSLQNVPFGVYPSAAGTLAVRGVNYELVDSSGETLTEMYFQMRAGNSTASIFLRPLQDDAITQDTYFLFRTERSNNDASLGADGAIGVSSEVAVQVTDVTAPVVPNISFAFPLSNFTEPDGTATADLYIEVKTDTVSVSDIVATISRIDGDAIEGTDYTVSGTTATILAGQTTALYPISILGNDVFQGDRDVRFQISSTTIGVPLPGASEHLVTILDNDVDANWDVIWDPAHAGGLSIGEGGTTFARLLFQQGVPNASDVLVAWELDGPFVTLGVDLTTSAPSPITIPAGETFIDIPLVAPENGTVEGDRAFDVTITGVSGGSAEVGPDPVIPGVLMDTTVIPPVVQWADQSRVIIEGTQTVVQLVLNTPIDDIVRVRITRTGTADITDLTYGGDATGNILTIPAQQTVVSIPFTAILDAPDPGETAQFEIGLAVGAEIGPINILTVTVAEQVIGASTVEFNATPGMDTLVSACTGFSPTPTWDPPKVKIGGMRADVFPIDVGRRQTNPTGWECVVYTDGSAGTLPIEFDDGTAPLGAGYDTADISGLEFILQTYSYDAPGNLQLGRHVVTLGEGLLVEVTKDGHYLREETWFLRPRLAAEAGTKHEYCLQILAFVSRRPDGVRCRAMLMNDGYDPTRPEGHYGSPEVRHELDGSVYFQWLQNRMPSGGPQVYATPDKPRCQNNQFAILPSLSHTVDDGFGNVLPRVPPHVIHPCRRYAWDFGIFSDGVSEEQRNRIMEGSGEGWVMDGPMAVWMNPWFGAAEDFIPEPTNGYRHRTGKRGLEATRGYGEDYVNQCLAAMGGWGTEGRWLSVDDSAMSPGEPRSWFMPSTYGYGRASGGSGILLQQGFDMSPASMRGYSIDAKFRCQADGVGITDINTGLPATSKVMADGNVNFPDKSPMYGSTNGDQSNREWHWFLSPALDRLQAGIGTRPSDRNWNNTPVITATTHPLFVQAEPAGSNTLGPNTLDPHDLSLGVGNAAQTWGEHDFDHHARYHAVFIALAWTRNSSFAKYMLRKIAARVENIYQHIEMEGLSLGDSTLDKGNFELSNYTLRCSQTNGGGAWPATDTESFEWGGMLTFNSLATGGTFRQLRTRGEGHVANAQAAAGAITDPGQPDYDSRGFWWAAWRNASIQAASPFGCMEREGIYDRQENPPGGGPFARSDNWPAHGSQWDPSSYIPVNATSTQGWKPDWYGARHFAGNKVYGDNATYMGGLRKMVDGNAFSRYRVAPAGSRVAGRSRPMHHVVSTLGVAGKGGAEKPGPVAASWDVRHSNGSPALADSRIHILTCSALRALDENGLTAEYNELLGYLKEALGLAQGASLDAMIANLMEQMYHNVPEYSRYKPGYVADLLGFLQHKNRS